MMKVRTYNMPEMGKGLYFCPACHCQIELPFKGGVHFTGAMNFTCSCKGGRIIIKPIKVSEGDANGE